MMSQDTHFVDVVWRIENYTYCCLKKGEVLESPTFSIDFGDPGLWFLKLYPKGKNKFSDLGFFLNRAFICPSPSSQIAVNYDLALVDLYGQFRFVHSITRREFKKGDSFGWYSAIEESEILENQNELLPGNALTICCRIWPYKLKCLKRTKVSLRSRIQIKRYTYQWNIENFFGETKNVTKMFLFVPNDAEKESTNVKLSYVTDPGDESIHVVISDGKMSEGCWKCRVEIMGDEHGFLLSESIREASSRKWQQDVLITRQSMLEDKAKYSKDDTLSLVCDICFVLLKLESSTIVAESESPLWKRCNNGVYLPQTKTGETRIPKYTLQNDVHRLYKDKTLCDLTIDVKETMFDVHSVILASRSPVFKRIIESVRTNCTNHIVHEKHLDVDTAGRLLDYIYTDDPGGLNMLRALNLYHAACMYEVDGLKAMCLKFLRTKFTVGTIGDVLEFADVHGHDELMTMAVQFISEHEKAVLLSNEFEAFSEKNASLTVKIMLNIAKLKLE